MDSISIPDFLIRHYFHLEGAENVPRISTTPVTGEEHSLDIVRILPIIHSESYIFTFFTWIFAHSF
jgi:hypothetical protein